MQDGSQKDGFIIQRVTGQQMSIGRLFGPPFHAVTYGQRETFIVLEYDSADILSVLGSLMHFVAFYFLFG
jgi:hypothetical protein